MNDLKICARIAEIDKGAGWLSSMLSDRDIAARGWEYNPLTDDALCFQLMVKYDVYVEPSDKNAYMMHEDGYPINEVVHFDGTLNKAICLAIIEAHEEGL